MNFGFSNRRALLILALMLIVLAGGGVVSSKWQAGVKYLNKNAMEATVAPESFYFEDSQNQLQQSLSQIGELGQDEISPAEPVQENENMPSKSEIPLTMEEIQDRVDDIAEQIDIITEEVKKLALNDADEPDNQEDADQDSDDSDNQQVLANLVSGRTSSELVYCQKTEQGVPSRDMIIFNEIAWMGTKMSSNDEWIELKNISSNPVDLTGWQIVDKDQQIKIAFEAKIIPATGFMLLERTDDTSVPFITADLIYSGVLNDENEELYLFSPGCALEDEVIAVPAWPAGDKSGRKTMERSFDLNWHTYYGLEIDGISGTPKAQNSQAPLPNPFPDTNNDKKINVLDLILIRNHLGSNDPLFDANNDGAVDIKDLEYVRNNLNRAPSAPAAQNEENMASDGSVLEPENAEVPLENEVILNGPVDEPLENTAAEVRRSEDAIAEEETPEPADVSQPSESESAAEVEAVNSEQNNVAAEAPVNSQNEGVVSESLPADLPAQQPGQQNDSPTQQP